MSAGDQGRFAPPTGLLVGVCVTKGFMPALVEVINALQRNQPRATTDQLLDLIFLRGLVGYTDDLNLPRAGSNPDEDA